MTRSRLLRPASPARALLAPLCALLLGGCATRAVDVQPLPTSAAEFALWDCARIDDELDAVQQRAADLAYDVDQRVGNNIVALGVGVAVFWPALLALRPDGLEARDLARLKGRFEALRTAARERGCPPPAADLPAARAAALPVAVGERLVYEDRTGTRQADTTVTTLQVLALRRDEIEFRLRRPGGGQPWRQDRAGNVTRAPDGSFAWPRLLRHEPALGQVLSGDIVVVGDPLARARVRGQVVAIGPQWLDGRRFEAVVIELFGDAQRGDDSRRLDGAIVIDRHSGTLLRLDLDSAMPGFRLQRRLVRVDPAEATTP
ncbi:hypothetical protein ACPOLB_08690 [Rubrivivax sp. RP6-9]|uniref:hypothetical protein n=1 Tax=Rubrivivax sp. RP6-9 TaxID=3415750 RepID=UPI003CC6BE43